MKEESGTIYAFINTVQAARFGHVGWGFQLGPDRYLFGSSDHLFKHSHFDLRAWWNYMHVPRNGEIDWWAEEGNREEMLSMMRKGHHEKYRGRHIQYHLFKELQLDKVKPELAVSKAEELKSGGWDLTRHNCVHHAYLIFSSYSTNHKLPDPFADPLNLIPKSWFARIKSQENRI